MIAPAANHQTVYPRVGGETKQDQKRRVSGHNGVYPRVGGETGASGTLGAPEPWSIWAGKPLQVPRSVVDTVYPRVGGETHLAGQDWSGTCYTSVYPRVGGETMPAMAQPHQ